MNAKKEGGGYAGFMRLRIRRYSGILG